MYKRISKEIREEILSRIKNEGIKVPQIAQQYGISDKTIYTWLREGVTETSNPILELNRLRRENEDLLKIIGKLTADEARKKKKF